MVDATVDGKVVWMGHFLVACLVVETEKRTVVL